MFKCPINGQWYSTDTEEMYYDPNTIVYVSFGNTTNGYRLGDLEQLNISFSNVGIKEGWDEQLSTATAISAFDEHYPGGQSLTIIGDGAGEVYATLSDNRRVATRTVKFIVKESLDDAGMPVFTNGGFYSVLHYAGYM